MNKITVVNKKTYKGDGIYIGRPSPLGNPFLISGLRTREESVMQYRWWLWNQIQLPANCSEAKQEFLRLVELAKITDLVLICWCAPKACHGDVLKAAIEWYISTNQ